MDIFAPFYSRKGKILNSDGSITELEPLTSEDEEGFLSYICSCKDEITDFLIILVSNLFE
jgi:hypothetical protein